MTTKPRLTRKALAARWCLQTNTLAHWAVTGRGPKFIRVADRVLYDLEEVERWEAERTYQSTAEFDTGARAVNVQKALDVRHGRAQATA